MADEIGRAKIVVEADIEAVSSSVSDAKTEVESLGDAGEAAGKKVESSVSGATDALESGTAGARRFVGALSSVAGIATGLIGIFGLLTGAIAGFMALLEKLNSKNEIGGITQTTENLEDLFGVASGEKAALSNIPVFKSLTDQIDNLNEKIENAKIRGTDFVVDESVILRIDDAAKKLDDLRVAREKFRKQAIESSVEDDLGFGDEAAARFEEYKKNLEAIKQQADAINRGLIDDPLERSIAEQEASIRSTEKMLEVIGAINSEQGDALLEAIRARGDAEREEIRKTIQARIDAENDAIAKKEQRDREAAERTAKAAADAFERAMEPIIASLTSSFGTGFTTQLSKISSDVENAVDELRKVKRGKR